MAKETNMEHTIASNGSSSLTDVWKNYFGVWISPPDRIISWLNLNEINGSSANQSDINKHHHFSKLLFLRPNENPSVDLEQTIETSSWPSSEQVSQVDVKFHQTSENDFGYEMLLFAFSATDPLGQQVSPEENRRQNALLWQDLLEFKTATEKGNQHEVFLFHGAGFIDDGSDWLQKSYHFDDEENISESYLFDFVESNFPCPEKGFLVSISTIKDSEKYEKKFTNHSRDSRADLRNKMINLARKYQQGGIFEFTRGSKNNLIRSTVPVCIPDCQSKAELEIFPLKTHP